MTGHTDHGRRPGRPKGHPKSGGRQRGAQSRSIRLRLQALEQAALDAVLTAEQLEALSPLAVMRLIMAKRLEGGDLAGALLAATAAAPYVHARLSSSDVTVRSDISRWDKEQLEAEAAAIEAKMYQIRAMQHEDESTVH